MAYNAESDSYLVAWASSSNGGLADLKGQLVGSDGALVGSQLSLQTADPTGYGISEVDVQANALSDEFLVVWSDKEVASYATDLFGLIFDAQTQQIGSREPVVERDSWTFGSDISAAPDGSFLLTWMDSPNAFDIAARTLSSDLQTLGEVFEVGSSDIHDVASDSAYSPALDAYLVTWMRHYNAFSPAKVWGRWVTATGTMLSPPFMLDLPQQTMRAR